MESKLRKRVIIIWLLVIFATPAIAYYFVNRYEPLPTHSRLEGWEQPGDTTLLSNYLFTDQTNHEVSLRSFPGKIIVVNFFFSRCLSLCPRMMNGLKKVTEAYRSDPAIHFLSFTVDPAYDRQDKLESYAESLNVDPAQWQLLTGSKQKIYRLARTGFHVDAAEGDGGPQDFIHSDKIILVDPRGNIRGYYSGIVAGEMDQLISNIKKLQHEY